MLNTAHRLCSLAVMCSVLAAGCDACADDDVRGLAPLIDIGDPFDTTESVCELLLNGEQELGRIVDCAYNFGEVGQGRDAAMSFRINNASPVPLTIRSMTWEAGSDESLQIADAVPETVAAGGFEDIDILFTPAVASTVNGTLVIDTDAENTLVPVKIAFTGTGGNRCAPSIAVAPASCNFGEVGVGASASCTVSLSNDSECDLTILDGRFEDPTQASIFRTQNFVVPATILGRGAPISLTVYGTPQDLTLVNGAIILETNDPNNLEVRIPLSIQGADTPTALIEVLSINGVPDTSTDVEILDDVVVTGVGSRPGSTGGTIQDYAWSVDVAPGSGVRIVRDGSGSTPTAHFEFAGNRRGLDAAGPYIVYLTVTDDNGATSTNMGQITLNASAGTGLVVQLSWDTDTDIDLHLNRGDDNGWCSTESDCYYGNKTPSWGARLDIDDLDGFGPENVNHDSPPDGAYRIGVTYYSGGSIFGGGGSPATQAQVKIFYGGALLDEFFGTLNAAGDHWFPATVNIVQGLATVQEQNDFNERSQSCLDSGI
jgi:hypothetical protein